MHLVALVLTLEPRIQELQNLFCRTLNSDHALLGY
jgi:hypothetical protein